MNNGSQGFCDYLELIPPKMIPSFPDENIPKCLQDDNMPILLSDMVIPPSSTDLFWATAKNETQNKAKEPKKENVEDEQQNFLAAPSYLQSFDPNALPGLIVPSTGSSGQQFPNFSTSTNSIADFGMSPLAPLGSNNGHNVMTPVDVRELLGNGQMASKGPADRSNHWMSGGLSNETRSRGTKRSLPSKLVELGVSERLTKLERLIRKPDKDLTTFEKAEKKNIMRLEKNRRAAAVSRERKKRYIRSLEERSIIMAKHLDALERENSKLRALLSDCNGGVELPPPLPSLQLSPLPEMPLDRKTSRRTIKKEKTESDTSHLGNLHPSDLRNPSSGLNTEGMLDMSPLCTTNDGRKSKRLR